jgi:hypothetical protein
LKSIGCLTLSFRKQIAPPTATLSDETGETGRTEAAGTENTFDED